MNLTAFEKMVIKKVVRTKNQKIVHSFRKIGLVTLIQKLNFCKFKISLIAKKIPLKTRRGKMA